MVKRRRAVSRPSRRRRVRHGQGLWDTIKNVASNTFRGVTSREGIRAIGSAARQGVDLARRLNAAAATGNPGALVDIAKGEAFNRLGLSPAQQAQANSAIAAARSAADAASSGTIGKSILNRLTGGKRRRVASRARKAPRKAIRKR